MHQQDKKLFFYADNKTNHSRDADEGGVAPIEEGAQPLLPLWGQRRLHQHRVSGSFYCLRKKKVFYLVDAFFEFFRTK
jgi:hypothetical protein